MPGPSAGHATPAPVVLQRPRPSPRPPRGVRSGAHPAETLPRQRHPDPGGAPFGRWAGALGPKEVVHAGASPAEVWGVRALMNGLLGANAFDGQVSKTHQPDRQSATHRISLAERGGFEPPRPVTQPAAFRVRCDRPLCHLSRPVSEAKKPAPGRDAPRGAGRRFRTWLAASKRWRAAAQQFVSAVRHPWLTSDLGA